MVQLHRKSMEFKVHSLIANKKISTMKEGDMKKCLIMELSDKRYAVFAFDWADYFYIVLSSGDELNETFNEQLQIIEP